jgi:hypothetical protein
MKYLLVAIFSLIQMNILFAQDCNIDTKNAYFEDLEGEPIGDPGTSSYRIEYVKRSTFTPDPPREASLSFPFKGDCSDLVIFKVEIYGQIGPDTFPKDNHSHEGKGLGLVWLKKPLYSGKKELSFNQNLAIIKTFEINKLMKKAPKDKHTWKLKFIVKYQESSGATKTFERVVDSPLMH